jgi:hypothetical protein
MLITLDRMPTRFPALSLDKVRKWAPVAAARGVSVTARGRGGFLPAFRRAGGRLGDMGTAKDGQRWTKKRRDFLRRHLTQVIETREPLFQADGTPTRRHLALICWGYSPAARRL